MTLAARIAVAAAIPLAVAALAFSSAAQTDARKATPVSLAEPHGHDNLTVYFVRGADQAPVAPSTLAEALESGAVKVYETGDVNQLMVENQSDEEVFVNAGDIVKGGQQDRVLAVSLIIPPRSGRMPIAAFCVEQGRWSQRGDEASGHFSASQEMAPLKDTRLALKGVTAIRTDDAGSLSRQALQDRPQDQAEGVVNIAGAQSEVWRSVSETQRKLAENIAAPVAASESPSSLQLALEHDALQNAKAPYLEAIEPYGMDDESYVGVVFAINGRLSSAEIYSSNKLFRKMWPKLARAAAVEAISERAAYSEQKPPSRQVVERFLSAEAKGEEQMRELPAALTLVEKHSPSIIYSETKREDGELLHRSYLAR